MKHARGRAFLRRLAILAGAAALASGFAIAGTASSAYASSPCPSYAKCCQAGCAGHDPSVYDCAVSSTVTVPVDYNGTQYATLWNRYSWECDANWARAQLTTAGINAGDSLQVGIDTNNESMCYPSPDNNTGLSYEPCTNSPNWPNYFPPYSYGGSSAAYTDMVNGTNATDAWVNLFDNTGNNFVSAQANQ